MVPVCWECKEGHHQNCANAGLTDDDQIVECECWVAEHHRFDGVNHG